MKTITDKTTRSQAIPFEATAYSNDGTGGVGTTDVARIISTDEQVIMRLCKPDNGQIIEAVLNLQITVASALSVKVGIGRFAADTYSAATGYSQQEIDNAHRKIFGNNTAIPSSGTLLMIDGVDILKALPKEGDANYSRDGFVLILQFSRARVGTDVLKRFNVMCSALMGLV